MTVLPRPAISPTLVSVSELSAVTFVCSVFGLPLPNVTWLSNTTGTPKQLSATSSGIHIVEVSTREMVSSSLTLTSPRRFDSGQYSCSSTNELGTVTVTGTLSILCK